MEKNIKFNSFAHNEICKIYNSRHTEIYNEVEQKRLWQIISKITEMTGKSELSVLDVGAGTGNISLKFLTLKSYVTALDVSFESLEILKRLSGDNQKLKSVVIENKVFPIKKDQFDVVCAYSVLHHIPDYLFTINEMIRVCKPGGFIYIDHENNINNWFPNKQLKEYQTRSKKSFLNIVVQLIKTRELFSFEFIRSLFIRIFVNKKHKREGDIHVWKDDYLDWDLIEDVFKKENCRLVEKDDYLMYKPKSGIEVYNLYKNITNDTRYVIYKK